jgi:hypothetical protein
MSMFDSVWFTCPACGRERSMEAQSRVGERVMRNYTKDDCPPEVAGDVIGTEAWCVCGATRRVGGHVVLWLEDR